MTFYSCKKDIQEETSSAEEVRNAKTWYSKLNLGSVEITTSALTTMPIRFNPPWNEARTEEIEDVSVITVPVKTNLSKVFGEDSRFDLVLENKNGNFVAKTVSIKNGLKYDQPAVKTLWEVAFTGNNQSDKIGNNVEIRIFNYRFHTEKNFYYSPSGKIEITNRNLLLTGNNEVGNFEKVNKLMNMPPPGGECLNKQDWYFVETTYDDSGNVIDQYIEFLFSTCLDGAGGGGTTGPSQEEINLANAVPRSDSEFINADLTENSATTRKKIYKWLCAKSVLESFYSLDEGTHVKVSNVWQWQSLVHKSIVRSGVAPLITSTFTVNASDPTLGTYIAGMTLYWQHTGTATSPRGPLASNTTGVSNSPVFDSRD